MDNLLNETPLPVVGAAIFIALLAAREVGSWLARRRSPGPGGDETQQGYILSGVLGLLALLIAFTFGLALNRYETRRDLVVAEANAIGTAEMRVHLLDAPYSTRLAGLYRQYAETRLSYGQADADHKPALQRTSADLRARIQAETLAGVQPIRTTPLAALVVSAVNESLDVGAAREAAHAARLPTAVLAVLIVYALVAAGVLGSALGAGANPHRPLAALMFLLLTLALGLILDLDRARAGAITVSQAPMADLVRSLQAPAAAAASPPSPAAPASAAAGGSSRP